MMLELFNSKIPKDRRITLSYQPTVKTSPEEQLFPLMDSLYEKYRKIFDSLPTEQQEKLITQSYRNQCWLGEKDLTGFSEAEKRERNIKSAVLHDAFLEADTAIAKDFFTGGVSVSYRRDLPGCLHFGSCPSSTMQFWAAEGLLSRTSDRLIPWILSFEQQRKVRWETVLVDHKDFNRLGLEEIRLMENYRP